MNASGRVPAKSTVMKLGLKKGKKAVNNPSVSKTICEHANGGQLDLVWLPARVLRGHMRALVACGA